MSGGLLVRNRPFFLRPVLLCRVLLCRVLLHTMRFRTVLRCGVRCFGSGNIFRRFHRRRGLPRFYRKFGLYRLRGESFIEPFSALYLCNACFA